MAFFHGRSRVRAQRAHTVAAQRQAAQQAGGGGAAAKYDSYLGMLFPIEELRVFGFLSNCRVKLIAVLDDEEVKDGEMKALFRRLHALYVDTVSNPFHVPDSELYGCASFDRQVERIVEAGLCDDPLREARTRARSWLPPLMAAG